MRLENLKTFMKKIGGDESLKLEQRIFNISSFSISVFALVGTIANYLTGLNFTVIFLSFIGFIVTFSLFYLSRFKNKYSAHLNYLLLNFNGINPGHYVFLQCRGKRNCNVSYFNVPQHFCTNCFRKKTKSYIPVFLSAISLFNSLKLCFPQLNN